MKKIILIRHAKSDRSVSGLQDIDRPLNERGYADAHKTGAHLRDKVSGKILFISSPAVRALTTALIFAREINYPQENILIHPSLYEAEISDYMHLINSIDKKHDTVFIFGHNPTISQVAGQLSNTNVGDLPTCSVAVINFQTDQWVQLKSLGSTLEMQLFPKLLVD